jgi:NADH-quinone oxidoreductase subunit J
MTIVFLILAALTIFGTAAAMSLKNLVHCVLALMLGLMGLALIFLQLGAQFVGFTQVIVYVGAVAILAMFAIMMTRSAKQERLGKPSSAIGGVLIAILVFALLAWSFLHGIPSQAQTPQPSASVQQIGDALMHRFEIVGLLLTAALIGAGVIALDDREGARS